MWFNGLLDLSVMQLILVVLGMTHITIISVTLYLHRHSAHNSLDLHPVLKHFFRFWLWLTTAQNTKEWTAIHRKHHAKCEREGDCPCTHTFHYDGAVPTPYLALSRHDGLHLAHDKIGL